MTGAAARPWLLAAAALVGACAMQPAPPPASPAVMTSDRQAALDQLVRRIKQEHPDKFAFLAVERGELVVGLTDPSVLPPLLPPGLTGVRAAPAVYSDLETHARIEALTRQLRGAGLGDVAVGVDPRSGRVEFLTKRRAAALEAAIRSGAVTVEHGYVIRASEIVPTAG
jgi:hypothetical protein